MDKPDEKIDKAAKQAAGASALPESISVYTSCDIDAYTCLSENNIRQEVFKDDGHSPAELSNVLWAMQRIQSSELINASTFKKEIAEHFRVSDNTITEYYNRFMDQPYFEKVSGSHFNKAKGSETIICLTDVGRMKWGLYASMRRMYFRRADDHGLRYEQSADPDDRAIWETAEKRFEKAVEVNLEALRPRHWRK